MIVEAGTCSWCRAAKRVARTDGVAICGDCLEFCRDVVAEATTFAREREFACSFCGAKRTSKLMAGPGVFICDPCVARATAALA